MLRWNQLFLRTTAGSLLGKIALQRLVIVAVCVFAMISAFRFQRCYWKYQCSSEVPCTQKMWNRFNAKYESAESVMPANAEVYFIVDEQHLDKDSLPPGGRFFMVQYSLSPRRFKELTKNQDLEGIVGKEPVTGRECSGSPETNPAAFLVVDSDRIDKTPDFAALKNLPLVADLQNGLWIYRANVRR